MASIVFIDSEIEPDSGRVLALGAVREDGVSFHSGSPGGFSEFTAGADYVCGHNILRHDLKYIGKLLDGTKKPVTIDTLPLSPLLFPNHPYHKLLKDDKLQSEELNNPLNDAFKARELFYDELNAFQSLPEQIQWIYAALLEPLSEFQGFFRYLNVRPYPISETILRRIYDGQFCGNAPLAALIEEHPAELAYALALIGAAGSHSVTPPWVLRNYPMVDNILRSLCGVPCVEGCPYCRAHLDIHAGLKRFFGYDAFRTYSGEPLQERAAEAAVQGKSLLAIFPTGGGKSLTFQLPALMAGENEHGLTVVISPLQSLMKDQVDNLEHLGIVDAVTVNGLLSPVERAEALSRVRSGMANLLYISPEQLRSRTIEKLLLDRNVARFVIDEAHCFSAWGQDFRVDYLYIGEFIRSLQENKRLQTPIPVSCFTATAKQKVISDIRDYFQRTLNLSLELFATSAARENLRYVVLFRETEEEKYNTLRALIEEKDCPTIVYVSRTYRTRNLAERLTADGFPARPYNGGKMEASEKVENQEAFMRNEVKVIVATSAFGMGVDKRDVGLVVHYDISDSLENYMQESGRAGRDPSVRADCYVLFNNSDLDKHFILLNQTKLSIGEIQQVWKAVKELTRSRLTVCCSPLEIARQAGWDDSAGPEMETRVKTAISALENAGYLKRGRNMPRVYASSILARTMADAVKVLDASPLFDDRRRQNARRILSALISSRSTSRGGDDIAESRVDYLADMLGLEKREVVETVNLMRQAKLLEDDNDMSAYIRREDTQNRSSLLLERMAKLERFLLEIIPDEGWTDSLKKLNEAAEKAGVPSSVREIRTLLYYWTIKGYIEKRQPEEQDEDPLEGRVGKYRGILPAIPVKTLLKKQEKRLEVCRFILTELFSRADADDARENIPVEFSLLGLWRDYKVQSIEAARPGDMEDALLYLSKAGALILEGGFLVLYNGMEIKRLVVDNRLRYKVEDYRAMSEYYKQKIQQIHIVGEYANLMVRDYEAAMGFVQDYFQLDFRKFLGKYFKGDRLREIDRCMTPEKYDQLFGGLSRVQAEIIKDEDSKYIVVAAGPGSGKTRVLVHKLASLYCMEDVKHEQMLMVTFSRAAATEFKRRLMELIGNAAHFIEIKTFHSYCFDLLGKIGSLEGSTNVVRDAAAAIRSGEVELGRITKTVLVIDEAQDMDANEFALVEALAARNNDLRIIAVGDDDQNIYEFRGSDSKYLRSFITEHGARVCEMNENYRSCKSVVALANAFAETILERMKTTPGVAAREEAGTVRLVRHIGCHMEQPLVEELLKKWKGEQAAVLTRTNDEALRVLGLLRKNGVRSKLIQSMEYFRLYDLAEVRYFLRRLDLKRRSAKISDTLWEEAKGRLCEVYRESTCLPVVLNMIADFEETNRDRYYSDLEEFIRESAYEDFYGDEKETVVVSTVHKAKGREFESVYLLLAGFDMCDEAQKRAVYVGLTRAKNALYIHYNGDVFDRFAGLPGVTQANDPKRYPEPEELVLQLGHRDVFLNFFKERRETVFQLRSGQSLCVNGAGLSAEIEGRVVEVLRFSKACKERLQELYEKGYHITDASVRFMVAWKGEGDERETPVILPEIWLKKTNQ